MKKRNKKHLRLPRVVPYWIHVKASFNNTLLNLTNADGNTLNWVSTGSIGYKKSRRSTAYAAQSAGEKLAKWALQGSKKLKLSPIRNVGIRLRGIGDGRESAVKGIIGAGLKIIRVEDRTPIPHNGCRPPKKRRL